MSSPVEARLRRLRIILTLVFAGALATGLVILAVVAIQVDSNSRDQARDATMSERVEASSRLIYFSAAGDLKLDGLRDDDATVGSPEIRVYRESPTGFTEIFRGRGPRLPLTGDSIDEVAGRAVRSESRARLETTDAEGEDVVILATPFYNGARPAGAVVSATLTGPGDDGHRDLVLAMLIGCAALLVLATGAGWLLAGRSLRPAARGLVQQEALLADAAHELRNPIASIRSILEAAEIDPTTRERAIRTALDSATQLGDTVEILLTRARIDAGAEGLRRVPMRLDQITEDVVGGLPGGPSVRFEPLESGVVVEGDPVLIRIALRNLIDNALRHGHLPGSDAEVEVELGSGEIRVMDRGPGPPGTSGEGFHRFREGSPGGTGLGLSIAAWIAEAHGGSLALENREGGGTVAVLRLGG